MWDGAECPHSQCSTSSCSPACGELTQDTFLWLRPSFDSSHKHSRTNSSDSVENLLKIRKIKIDKFFVPYFPQLRVFPFCASAVSVRFLGRRSKLRYGANNDDGCTEL